jgi:hypothetical protein
MSFNFKRALRRSARGQPAQSLSLWNCYADAVAALILFVEGLRRRCGRRRVSIETRRHPGHAARGRRHAGFVATSNFAVASRTSICGGDLQTDSPTSRCRVLNLLCGGQNQVTIVERTRATDCDLNPHLSRNETSG